MCKVNSFDFISHHTLDSRPRGNDELWFGIQGLEHCTSPDGGQEHSRRMQATVLCGSGTGFCGQGWESRSLVDTSRALAILRAASMVRFCLPFSIRLM